MSPASIVGLSGVVAELSPVTGATTVTLPVTRSASESVVSAAFAVASWIVKMVSAGLTNSTV
ncbi:MAG: hypothetical protein BWY91_00808 [bacterium ADurb.BinA028]|nr:MAG: hypothetical protein BWY91_00808 [bacterium ADurb.BinA028]